MGGLRNPFRDIDNAFHNVDERVRKDVVDPIKKKVVDPIRKVVEGPIRSLAAADPFYQRLKTGRWSSPNTLIANGVHELYTADPLAKSIGIREKDAVTAAKVAGAAAAIYFTAGAASSLYGPSAAAVSGEAGSVASVTATGAKVGLAAKIGAVAGATSVAGQIYGTVEQRKSIQEAQDQARADETAFAQALSDANQPGAETPVMPGPDAASITQARRRSLAEQRKRRGRSSSILSDETNQALGA